MVRLQKYEDSMFQACINLFEDTFTKEPWNDVYTDPLQVTRYFSRCLESNQSLVYVLMDDERMVGLSIGFKKPWINGVEYYIDEFCIAYDRQGEGLGTVFLEAIREANKKEGLELIILATDRGYPSEAFYRKNGFTELTENIVFYK